MVARQAWIVAFMAVTLALASAFEKRVPLIEFDEW